MDDSLNISAIYLTWYSLDEFLLYVAAWVYFPTPLIVTLNIMVTRLSKKGSRSFCVKNDSQQSTHCCRFCGDRLCRIQYSVPFLSLYIDDTNFISFFFFFFTNQSNFLGYCILNFSKILLIKFFWLTLLWLLSSRLKFPVLKSRKPALQLLSLGASTS